MHEYLSYLAEKRLLEVENFKALELDEASFFFFFFFFLIQVCFFPHRSLTPDVVKCTVLS